MSERIETVLVAGYGEMGRGITASFARGGHRTIVLSRDPSKVKNAPDGVTVTADLPEDAPDLVIETIPEDMALKREFFERIETAYGGKAILATNTSGLPLQEMVDGLRFPERFLGIHYFHPADAFPMVEAIRCAQTGDDVFTQCLDALRRNGQEPIVVNKPVNGFLLNRIQHAMMHEAFYLIQDGVCSVEDVDNVCRLVLGPRMCVNGLIKQKDISGVNTTAASQRAIIPALYHNHEPCAFVQDMAARGDYGVKTGKGFYDWTGIDVKATLAKAADKMHRILAIAREG